MLLNIFSVLDLLQDIFFCLGYFSPGSTFSEKLSKEEENECIHKMVYDKDMEARNKLISHNLRLVAHVLKKYSSCPISQEDLLSIGTVGLIKGINTYNPQKATKFASYLGKCIDNEILMALRSENKTSMNVYLDDVIGSDEEGNNITLTDIIGASNDDVSSEVHLALETKRMLELIDSTLSDREKEIIILRYGLCNKKRLTQLEISQKLNISRSYVSRIEKKAIEKLSKEFSK